MSLRGYLSGARLKRRSRGPERTADRPHRITVFTSVVSTIVAFVAIFFSYQSWENSERALETSQQSLQVGQRAYLAIERSRLTVAAQPAIASGWLVRLDFDIRNLGRTPAELKGVEFVFDVPPGWKSVADTTTTPTDPHKRYIWPVLEQSNLRILQNQRIGYTAGAMFVVSAAAVDTLDRIRQRSPQNETTADEIERTTHYAEVQARLDYTDVFGDSHSLEWPTRTLLTRINSILQ